MYNVKKYSKPWCARASLRGCADARSGVGQEQWHNFWRTTLTIGDRIARPATIHWHTNVGRGGNMAKTQPDRIAIKRQLSLLGSVDWWLTNFMTNIIFQALLIFILVMLERREAYQDPTTRIRRSLCRQMVPEYRTPLPRPKSFSGLGY